MSPVKQDLDVEGDGMQGPPSPLQFDTALALEDQTIRAIAEAPMDILTGEDPDQVDLDTSGQELSERDVDAIMDDQVNSHLGALSSWKSWILLLRNGAQTWQYENTPTVTLQDGSNKISVAICVCMISTFNTCRIVWLTG